MFYYLSSINILKYGSQATKGITLNNETLNSIPISFPSYEEQEKIANFLSLIDKKMGLLENTLKPTESNFLKMLIAEKTKYELILIADDSTDAKITECFNTILEDVQEQKTLSNYDYITSIEDLDTTNQNITINKLMKYYRLAGNSTDHKENIFFTVKDINKIYQKYKAYKDVNDISKMLYRLSKKGYIEKLEYQYRKQNIYYLTSKCENLSTIPAFDKEIISAKREYMQKRGIEINIG